MLGLHVPAGLDVAVQPGVFGGRDPAAVAVPLSVFVAVELRLGKPAELLAPDEARPELLHLVVRAPLVAELLIAEQSADRFVIGIGLHGGHGQIEGQPRMAVRTAWRPFRRAPRHDRAAAARAASPIPRLLPGRRPAAWRTDLVGQDGHVELVRIAGPSTRRVFRAWSASPLASHHLANWRCRRHTCSQLGRRPVRIIRGRVAPGDHAPRH